MKITEHEHALRLAHAVLSDVALYNDDKLKASSNPRRDLAEQIGEARTLFRARVDPSLHAVFENAVTEKWGAADPNEPQVVAPPREPSTHQKSQRDAARELAKSEQDQRVAAEIARIKKLRMFMLIGSGIVLAIVLTTIFESERGHHNDNKHEGAH